MTGASRHRPISRLLGFALTEVEPGRAVFECAAVRVAVQPDRQRPRRRHQHAARRGALVRGPRHPARRHRLHDCRAEGQLRAAGRRRDRTSPRRGSGHPRRQPSRDGRRAAHGPRRQALRPRRRHLPDLHAPMSAARRRAPGALAAGFVVLFVGTGVNFAFGILFSRSSPSSAGTARRSRSPRPRASSSTPPGSPPSGCWWTGSGRAASCSPRWRS